MTNIKEQLLKVENRPLIDAFTSDTTNVENKNALIKFIGSNMSLPENANKDKVAEYILKQAAENQNYNAFNSVVEAADTMQQFVDVLFDI